MRAEWKVNLAAFTASLLLNGAVFYSFDQAMLVREKQYARQAQKRLKEKPMQFEFVEVPAETRPEKPRPTRRIASRDALNRDLSPDKSGASGAPRASRPARADQLAQRQKGVSSQAQPGILPQEEAPRTRQEAERKQPDSQSLPKAARAAADAEKAAPAAEPRAPGRGQGGRDKITTPEAAMDVKSTGARFYGFTSFEATGSGMGVYMKNLKEKVWLSWFAYLSFKYPRHFKGVDAIFGFTLAAHGEVKSVEVLDNGGDAVFADYCAGAVRRAGGFGDLPKDILALLGKDELEIRCAFHYR